MSRRCHHGSARHAPLGRVPRRTSTALPERPIAGTETDAPRLPTVSAPPPMTSPPPVTPPPAMAAAVSAPPRPTLPVGPSATVEIDVEVVGTSSGTGPRPRTEPDDAAIERGATAPQLRRFIKSRAYVPMHELRRRFAINSADDDVTPVDLDRRRVFVGLPEREGRLLGELLRGGDIGFELSLDPITPIVVGVYPMRPVTRA